MKRKNKNYEFIPELAYNKTVAKEFKTLATSYLEEPTEKTMLDIYSCLDDYYYDIIGFLLNTRRNEVCDMLFHKTLMMYIAPKTFKRAKFKTNKRVKFYPPDARKEMNYFRARCLRNFEEEDIYQILYMETLHMLKYLHESKDRRKNPLNITNYFFYVFPREFIKKVMSPINGLSSVATYIEDEGVDEDLKYSTEIELDIQYDLENDTLSNDWLSGKTASYPFNKLDYFGRHMYKSLYLDKENSREYALSLGYSMEWLTKRKLLYHSTLKYLLNYPQSKKIAMARPLIKR